MKLLLSIIIASIFLITLGNFGSGYAMTPCFEISNIESSFEESDLVFFGHVISTGILYTDEDIPSFQSFIVKFNVMESYKGSSNQTITLYPHGLDIEYGFVEGNDYLVFANPNEIFKVHACSATTQDPSNEQLSQLRVLVGQFIEPSESTVIGIGGIIFDNGTAILDQWYRFESGSDISLDRSGEITILYLDLSGETIAQTGFDLLRCFIEISEQQDQSCESNVGAFAIKIPDVEDAEKIILKRENQILSEVDIGLLPPFTITSPPVDAEEEGMSPMIGIHVTEPDGDNAVLILENHLLADKNYVNEKELSYAEYLIQFNCDWPVDVFDQVRNFSIYKEQQDIVIQTLQNAHDKCTRYQTITMNQISPHLSEITDFEAKCLVKRLDFATDNINLGLENRKYMSPKMQFFCEVPPDNVRCNAGLQLIFKSTDGSPACVTPQTVEKLIQREWGAINVIDGFLDYVQ